MKLYSLILLITFSFSLNHLAQDIGNYLLDSIVVTANRVPTSVNETGRSVVTILPQDILFLPANDIHDLLEYTSGIDLKQRGPEGIQSDISIRGGSFEQTLIMIDGIKLIDPQTGHHNMNIPLAISQVERIEILKGQGSRVHGANAFSGIINIIPKKNMNTAFDIDVQGGENAFWGLGVNGSLKIGQSSHRLSVSQKKSDGYRRNTEFNVYNLSMNNSIVFKNSVISTMFGFTQKDFGANSYYTVRFPDQAEITETSFASLSADISFLDLSLSPKFYWRRNNDEFVLDKFNPGFYKNNHETDVIGGEIQAATKVLGGSTSFGLEFTQDNINSNNLGKHNRQRKGFFIEQKVNLSKALNFSMGGYAYYLSLIHI
jgi:iron complex outermembrane receptor protein